MTGVEERQRTSLEERWSRIFRSVPALGVLVLSSLTFHHLNSFTRSYLSGCAVWTRAPTVRGLTLIASAGSFCRRIWTCGDAQCCQEPLAASRYTASLPLPLSTHPLAQLFLPPPSFFFLTRTFLVLFYLCGCRGFLIRTTTDADFTTVGPLVVLVRCCARARPITVSISLFFVYMVTAVAASAILSSFISRCCACCVPLISITTVGLCDFCSPLMNAATPKPHPAAPAQRKVHPFARWVAGLLSPMSLQDQVYCSEMFMRILWGSVAVSFPIAYWMGSVLVTVVGVCTATAVCFVLYVPNWYQRPDPALQYADDTEVYNYYQQYEAAKKKAHEASALPKKAAATSPASQKAMPPAKVT
ncbi:hypothetical protein, conserved [Leishmania tarentolae]|uniref:Transmembrane protein n=1 Tax=Leishmania tarentolae TaxID=5689 RepID=A0A640KIN2_LEITA|nr:hypothetical protein, conserved [Leishmania tarentolae]